MADAAADAPPPPPKQSGGFMGTLLNGVGIFVLTLVAVIVGGFINAKLHPLPDLQLDKDGKIKAIVPVAAAAHGEEGGAGKAAVYYAIDPPLVVNFEDGSVVRFLQITMEIMAPYQKPTHSAHKHLPPFPHNLSFLITHRTPHS